MATIAASDDHGRGKGHHAFFLVVPTTTRFDALVVGSILNPIVTELTLLRRAIIDQWRWRVG